jgi:hypothetical protein
MPICREQAPALVEISTRHSSACHLNDAAVTPPSASGQASA